MNCIKELLAARKLPELLEFADGTKVTADRWEERRLEMLDILRREEYGYAPPAPAYVRSEVIQAPKADYANKATVSYLNLTVPTDKGEFTFPIAQVVPTKRPESGKVPTFVLINFRPELPDKYFPVEDIVDAGCAVIRIYYNDVAFDGQDNFAGGIASHFDRSKYTWGKIGMWAWAASRAFDYLESVDWADLSRVAVIGHSRLGKTALWCAANDTRFAMACVNNSGCSGDAITRDKKGERVAQITKNFPFWFCDNYRKYCNNEYGMPFEQHFLVACVCPRKVAIGCALDDEWADPESQYLSACAASPAWELVGKTGIIHPDRLPVPGDFFHSGDVAYHLRAGAHFLSTEDWRHYLTLI
ncbi:MAG: acetylxylan esterase [Clostridia bacterium]|nr:acetylxylan esterase [Clostridia bacterium]